MEGMRKKEKVKEKKKQRNGKGRSEEKEKGGKATRKKEIKMKRKKGREVRRGHSHALGYCPPHSSDASYHSSDTPIQSFILHLDPLILSSLLDHFLP